MVQTVDSAMRRIRAVSSRLRQKIKSIRQRIITNAAIVKRRASDVSVRSSVAILDSEIASAKQHLFFTLITLMHLVSPPTFVQPNRPEIQTQDRSTTTRMHHPAQLRAASLGMLSVICLLMILPIIASATVPTAEAKQTSSRAENAIRTTGPDIIRTATGLGARLGAPVYLRALKKERKLEVWMQSKSDAWVLYKTFDVCAASGTTGPKVAQGDKQVPEGFYRIRSRDLNPLSQYHLSMDIGYPNAYDKAHGRTGGDIMIHGDCVSVGCLALGVDNRQIEELYTIVSAALAAGQREVPVHIFPFRMTDAAMAHAANSPHAPFWQMIKQGWDIFETTQQLPQVDVAGKNYVFNGTQPKKTLVASLDPASSLETARHSEEKLNTPPLPSRKPGMSVDDLLTLLPTIQTIPEHPVSEGDRITSLTLAFDTPCASGGNCRTQTPQSAAPSGDRIDTLPMIGEQAAGDTFDPRNLLR